MRTGRYFRHPWSGNWVERRAGKVQASCCGVNLASRRIFGVGGCLGGGAGTENGSSQRSLLEPFPFDSPVVRTRSGAGFRLWGPAAPTPAKRLRVTVWVHRKRGFDPQKNCVILKKLSDPVFIVCMV
jgi:hypothetical protein